MAMQPFIMLFFTSWFRSKQFLPNSRLSNVPAHNWCLSLIIPSRKPTSPEDVAAKSKFQVSVIIIYFLSKDSLRYETKNRLIYFAKKNPVARIIIVHFLSKGSFGYHTRSKLICFARRNLVTRVIILYLLNKSSFGNHTRSKQFCFAKKISLPETGLGNVVGIIACILADY